MAAIQDQTKLPDGWEMKFDFNTRRYYYIDHIGKATSWVDPRPQYYANLAKASQERPAAASHIYPVQQTAPAHQPVIVQHPAPGLVHQPTPFQQPVRVQQPSSSSHLIPDYHHDDDASSVAEDFTNLAEYEYEFRVLRARYPTVTKERIMDLLEKNKGSITKTEVILKEEKAAADALVEFDQKSVILKKEFPDLEDNVILNILKQEEGHLARCRGKLRGLSSDINKQKEFEQLLDQKAKILLQDFPDAELSLIREVLRACCGTGSSNSAASINLFLARNKLVEMGLGKPTVSESEAASDKPGSSSTKSDKLPKVNSPSKKPNSPKVSSPQARKQVDQQKPIPKTTSPKVIQKQKENVAITGGEPRRVASAFAQGPASIACGADSKNQQGPSGQLRDFNRSVALGPNPDNLLDSTNKVHVKSHQSNLARGPDPSNYHGPQQAHLTANE